MVLNLKLLIVYRLVCFSVTHLGEQANSVTLDFNILWYHTITDVYTAALLPTKPSCIYIYIYIYIYI